MRYKCLSGLTSFHILWVIDLSTYNENVNGRNELISLLRNELPVLRAKARISQEDLADKMGISRQTYSYLETGKREMSWTTFLALIGYFQNNEDTRKMLENIEGLSEGIETIMNE